MERFFSPKFCIKHILFFINKIMFNSIDCNDLSNHFDKKLYRYQMFQITDIIIDGFSGKSHDYINPIFNIREGGGKQVSFMDCEYCIFFTDEKDAKKQQAIDVHKMLNCGYNGRTKREKSLQEYFRKFIDIHDLDFFISSVTNHQLHEEEFFKLLSLIAIDFPELLI